MADPVFYLLIYLLTIFKVSDSAEQFKWSTALNKNTTDYKNKVSTSAKSNIAKTIVTKKKKYRILTKDLISDKSWKRNPSEARLI